METAKRTGLGLMACAVAGLMVAMLAPQTVRDDSSSARPYLIAISGTSELRLIELGGDWPTMTETSSDRLLYCRHVARLAGLEFGTSCAREATTIADASL